MRHVADVEVLSVRVVMTIHVGWCVRKHSVLREAGSWTDAVHFRLHLVLEAERLTQACEVRDREDFVLTRLLRLVDDKGFWGEVDIITTHALVVARDHLHDGAIFRHADREGIETEFIFVSGLDQRRFTAKDGGTLCEMSGEHHASGCCVVRSCAIQGMDAHQLRSEFRFDFSHSFSDLVC